VVFCGESVEVCLQIGELVEDFVQLRVLLSEFESQVVDVFGDEGFGGSRGRLEEFLVLLCELPVFVSEEVL